MSIAAAHGAVVPVIDLFAGPGGLGEGFGAFRVKGSLPFDVRLSIEKDAVACATLTVRKFFRQFERPPSALDAYAEGQATLSEVFAAHRVEAKRARSGVWKAELGKVSPRSVTNRVRDRLRGSPDWVLLG